LIGFFFVSPIRIIISCFTINDLVYNQNGLALFTHSDFLHHPTKHSRMKKFYILSILAILFACHTAVATVTLTQNGSTSVSCAGGSNGSATIIASGGTAPYTYTWSPAPAGGQGTVTATGLSAGNYTCTVHDAVAAVGSCVMTVNQTPALTAVTTPTNVLCSGGNNGGIQLTANGGTPGYTYTWTPAPGGGQGTHIVTSLTAGTYTCNIMDGMGCTFVSTTTVTAPLPISITPSQTNGTCGNPNGTATVTVSGGTPGYTYTWTPAPGGGQGTTTATGLSPGTYTCNIADSHNCQNTQTFAITNSSAPTSTISHVNVACNGACNGTGTMTAFGGTTPYTYSWSPTAGSTTTISGLCPNTYSCTVTDQFGCQTSQTMTITQPPVLTSSSSPTNIACYGSCTGAATITPSGGNPAYTYSWSPSPGGGQGTATANSLCAQNYTCTITDAMGCITSKVVTITSPSQIIPGAVSSQINVTCYGACNGSASVNFPAGGTAPYTYSWHPSGGTSTSTTSTLCPGSYTCFVTDNNGCGAMSSNVSITQPATALSITPSQTNVTCGGGSNGSATATAGGGTPGYTYVWSPAPGSGQGTSVANGLNAGTYTCTAKDANNCSTVQTYTITSPSVLTSASSGQTNINCFGGSNGSASASIGGGSPTYIYSWTPTPAGGQGTLNATGLIAGTYTFTVKDLNNCTSTVNYVITTPSQLATNVTGVNVTCNGNVNGSATSAPTGGTAPYTYSWTPVGGTAATISALAPNSYSCTVTDNKGCALTGNISITQPANLTLTPSHTNILCGGASTGSATATAGGGVPPYTYSWTPVGGTASIASNLAAGTYTCTMQDANGCALGQNYTITSPAALIITPTQTNNTCFGTALGSATGTVSGGTPSYTYSWSPAPGGGQGTATATGLANGTYTLTVKDINNCQTTQTYNISSPPPLTASPINTPVTCNGACNGTINANVAGGFTPYTYSWNSGQTTATLSSLCPATYSCTATDNHGCTVSLNATIIQPLIVAVTPSSTGATCSLANGTAAANASGGTGAFTYSWSQGGTLSSVTGLAGGTYSCTVKDANNCSVTQPYNITQTNAPTLFVVPTNVTCNGSCTGSASATPSGGTPPYVYSWAPSGGTASTASGLCANTYTCHVSDQSGCTTTQNATITQPALLVIAPTQTNASCGIPNGSATASPSGGTGAFTYSWSQGGTTASITNLAAGTYSCSVKDANNCTVSHTYTITQSSAPTLVFNKTNVLCNGSCTGAATAIAAGGTAPYTYSWTGPLVTTSSTISNLCANTYTCVATDQNGCLSPSQLAVITQPSVLTASAVSFTNEICNGNQTGTAQVSAAGGASNYTYSWTGGTIGAGQGTSTASALAAGTYTCTVSDGNNCTASQVFTITQPPPIVINVNVTNITCNAICNGGATTAVSGGTGAYTYSWSGGQTIGSINGQCAGTYTCDVTDNSGCVASQSCILNQPTPLTNTLTPVNSACGSVCTGSLTASPAGGVLPYMFSWSPSGQTANAATALCAGSYTCTLTDANGCTATSVAGITTPLSPQITGAVTGSISGSINSGWAYLVHYDSLPKAQKLIDSVALSAGRYTFTGSIGGKFLVYAIATPATYPNAIKTYSKNADQWKNAVIINAACATKDTADIALIEMAPTVGAGSLGGNISQGAGFVPRLAFGTPVVILGEPIPGLDVNLEQHPNGIIAGTTTDANGNYHFGHVPPGTFSVYVDIPGLGMVSQYTKTVTTNEMFPNLNYVADSTHIYPDSVTVITGVTKPALQASDLILAPNPFRDQLNVAYTLSETSDVVIELFTVLGEKVAAVTKTHQDPGVYSFRISAAEHNLSQGVYMFRMTKEGKTITRRIVSIR
jgi:hypothetical protein